MVFKGKGILFPFYSGKPIFDEDDDDKPSGGAGQGSSTDEHPDDGDQPDHPGDDDDPGHSEPDPVEDPDGDGGGDDGGGDNPTGDTPIDKPNHQEEPDSGDNNSEDEPQGPGHVQVDPDDGPTEQELRVGKQLKSATKTWINKVKKTKLPKLPKEAAKHVENELNEIESELDKTSDGDLEKLEDLYVKAENVNHGIKFYQDGIFRKDSVVVLPSGDGLGVNVFIKRIAKKVGSVDGVIYSEVIEDTYFPLYWNIGVKKMDQHHGTGYILFPGEYDSVDKIKKLFVCGIGTENISEITKWNKDNNDDYVDWERVEEALYDTVKTTQQSQESVKPKPSPSQSLQNFAKPRTYKELEKFLQMNGADVHFSQDPAVQYASPSTDEILYYLELYKIK